MNQRRVAHQTGRKCLAWLLLIAIAFMGLTVTRQQALGSLHSHADHTIYTPSVLSTVVSHLASDWISRWQQQHAFGHGQLQLGAASDGTLWAADSAAAADASRLHATRAHDHDSLERHHHAAHDARVIAVDGATESADTANSAAGGGVSVLLPGVGVPSAGHALPEMAEHNGPWPVGRFVAFVSRSVPPLLRPPSL